MVPAKYLEIDIAVLNMKNGCASPHSQSGSMKCVVWHSVLSYSFKNSYLTRCFKSLHIIVTGQCIQL